MDNRTRTVVIGVVTGAWVTNFVVGLVDPSYKPSDAVHGVFLLIVGYMFTRGDKRNGNGRNGGGDSS